MIGCTTPVCEHLRDKRCHTGHGTTSVLLDWASREAMEGTVGPGSHHSFQGFRLHMTWTQPPTGGLTHHIALPRVLSENNASLVKYELEKFPQALTQGSKIEIVLKPPTQDHWNIALDPILPWILVGYGILFRYSCTSSSGRRSCI